MKVSSYDSYTEEYSKAKKQYNYQTEGDEEDDENDDLHQKQQYVNQDIYNHSLFQNYNNDRDNQSQTFHEESEGVLDYFHNRQNTEMNGDNEYIDYDKADNEQEQSEEEKQNNKYNYQIQKTLEDDDDDEVEIDLDQYQDESDQNFENDDELYKNRSNIENTMKKHFDQSPQKLYSQKESDYEQEIGSASHLKTLESKRVKSKNKKSKLESATDKDCQFCQWKIRRIIFLRENLHIRYFEAFNFYFAKPINEILANYTLSHVITLKDYQYYYDENEYLKRYYRIDEVPPRLQVLTNFFTNSYKQTRPNLIVTNQYKVISKRNFKQARLFMRQVAKNVNNGIGYNANNNLYNKDDSSESEAYSSDKNNESNQGGNSKGNKKKNNLPSKVLNSHLSQTIPLSQNQSNQTEEQSLSQNAHEYDNYRNFIMQMSFETSTHDIYYPSFSSKKEQTQPVSAQRLSNGILQKYNFQKDKKRDDEEEEEDYKNNIDDDGEKEEDGLEIDLNNEFLPPGIASYFEKREFQKLEKNLSSKSKKVNPFLKDGEGDEINPRLIELIIGNEQGNEEIQSNFGKQKGLQKNNQDSRNQQNINQIIEQMQQQQQSNYLNLLDLDTHPSANLEGGTQNLIGNGDTINNYDPAKRVSTLISQSNSTQMSHFNTFNANHYIIGTNSQRSQIATPSVPKQIPQKPFDRQTLAELHLGSNIVNNLTSLNTEGRSSEPSIQPIFREGFNYSNPIYQNEIQRHSNGQLPLRLQDLSSNAFQNQYLQNLIQSQEDLSKEAGRVKQNDSKKKLNSSQKSIQQVQQYILSQIKKQHDFLNMGRNQQANSTQNSQHPFYTSLSPEQKEKKDQGSNQQKGQKQTKVSQNHPKEFNETKGKSNPQYNTPSVQNSNRKLLNERNFTEVNLGSVFEKLKLSNRLASLESKQKNIINESNNLENFIQKIANNSLSRNNSTKKKKSKQSGGNTARTANQAISNDISPLGYTPRNFAKKNSTQKVDPSTSLKYLHTEQSPDQNRKLSHMTNNLVNNQIGDKKNSLSQNQLNNNSSMKKIGNSSKVKEQASIDNGALSGRVSVSPSQYPYKNQTQTSVPKSTNTITQQMTTTIDSLPGNSSVVNSLFKDSIIIKPTNSVNKRISSISNLRSKIISAGEQKSSLNSPSRICTDRESQNPRLKQNKSPSLNTHGGVSKISQKKTTYKRYQNAKIYSPNSHSYQKQTTSNVLQNNYYQKGQEFENNSQINPNLSLNIFNNNWNASNQIQQQQQTQQSESSTSNLQIQLLQQIKQNLIAATTNTNNASSIQVPPHHGSVPQLQQTHQLNGLTSLTSSQTAATLSNQKNSNKTISQKILTNALTNTINKFYKNIIKNVETDTHRDNPSPLVHQLKIQQQQQQQQQINKNQNGIYPQQNQQQFQQSAENDLSPRLTPSSIQNYQKQNTKKQSNNGQSRQQGRVKVGQSEEIAQKLIKSLCKQRVKQKDSIGSSNQMSLNLETLNSARASSIAKGQEFRVSSQNGNYGVGTSPQPHVPTTHQAISNSKQKQLLMRQKGSNCAQNNICMTSLNGLISNQSINSSVNNINPQSINYITNNTNNINSIQSNINSTCKTNNQKSINPSNYNSKNNNNQVLINNNVIFNINNHAINGIANSQAQNNSSQLPYPQLNQQQQYIQQQQQQFQNQGMINQDNSKQPHHSRIDSVKKVNSPRQSQPLIKPPQMIQQIGNQSQITMPKQSDYRAVKTEAPLLTEESQQQIITSFKNILNQNNIGMNNNGFTQLNNSQQHQVLPSDLLNTAPIQSSNQKFIQQLNANSININQNNNSTTIQNGQQIKNISQNNQNPKIQSTLSPGRVVDTKKKNSKVKEENQLLSNLQQQQQQQGQGQGFQLLTSLANAKKVQDEFQLGNGFYTQRNTGNTRKKSNEQIGSNQKYIQSSRGSYQGHYADLSAWKHASISHQNGVNQQQGQQQNLNVVVSQTNQKEKSQNQQYSTMLNTSPIRQAQQQQQNINQYVNHGNYQISNSNQNNIAMNQQNVQTPLTQQQTAGLLNHKIKQLSQKFQLP